MRKSALLSIVTFILLFSTSAFSYDIQIAGNIPLSDNLTGISINPSTGMAASISSQSKTLYIIDTNSNTVIKKISLDGIPSCVTVDAGKNLAIISSIDGILQFIDIESGGLIKTISTGKAIHSVAIDGKNNSLFIGNSNSLMVMDLETGNMVKEMPMTSAILAMDVDPYLGYLTAIMEGKEGISFYNESTLEPIAEITAGGFSGLAINPSTHIAVATNKSDNSVSIVSLENKRVFGTISFSGNPDAVAVDPSRNTALIACKDAVAVVKLENPVPRIDLLIPESSMAGSSGFTLSIKGSKFVQDSRTRFNLKDMDTLFEDNDSLKALIPSEELLSPGYVPVSVLNPPPGGGESGKLLFGIINPVPRIESLKPSAVALTAPPSTIRVTGKNFLNGSIVNLNGKNLKTRFISTILLEADLDMTDLRTPANYPVTVINPVPVTLTSNMVFLSVVESEALLPSAPGEEEYTDEEKATRVGSLTGKILNTDKEPIEGVTIKTKRAVTQTDAAGNFRLDNLPEGKNFLLLDGSTARDTTAYYPTIPTYVQIMPGPNTLSYQPYMHKQKARNFKEIDPSEDTILTDPEVPGFEMRIPKGVNITGWDGSPNLRVSVRNVPPDRLSMKPLPPNAHVRSLYMFYFDKIGGGIPDRPIPIKMPNDLGLLPGEKAVLWYFDESPIDGEAPNDWAMAGTATVTRDGRYLVSDPGFGIPKFCCGVIGPGGPGGPGGGSGGGPGGCGGSGSGGQQPDCDTEPSGYAGEPVDLTTGYFIHAKTDLHMPGIIPVNITRYYRSGEPGIGIFSKGTYFEYDWFVREFQDVFLVITSTNTQYSFSLQPDGTYINTKDPSMRGAVLTKNPADNTKILKKRDGTSYKFSADGYLVRISDRNGNALVINRTGEGYMQEIVTPENRTITFNSTPIAHTYRRVDSIVDSAGRTVKYDYETDPFSSLTRLKTVTYPDGSTMEYEYDSSGRMSGFRNGRGYLEVLNEYYPDNPDDPEQKNRIYRQTLADGGTYIFNYTVAGGHITETSMTAPNGAVTTWRLYDDSGAYRDGYITKKTTPDGITTYQREAGTNLVTSVTDPLGRERTYTYYYTSDATDGLVMTLTDNLGNVTSYEYETKYGLPTKITDALTKATTYTYTFDANNKVTKTVIKDPLLNSTTINYNGNGMPTSITDPNTNTTTLTYDTTKPAELVSISDPLSNTTGFSYDSLGRLETVTDAKSAVTSYSYDPMDRIASVTDPIDGITRYFYDPNGNLVILADAKGNMIWYEYDDRNRITEMTDQLGRVESYAYYRDAEILTHGDNLKSVSDRKGQITTYSAYDAMNRVMHITHHDGSYTDYTYDVIGRVDYINDSVSGYIDYTYNDFGCTTCTGRGMDRISKEVTPLGTIDYTYDKVGRRVTMTVAGQPVVNYVYDATGRMTSISTKINNKSKTYTLAYDNGSRRTSLKIPVSTKNKYVTTTYGYDIANRLLSMLQQGPSAQIENLLYEYDSIGNRTKYTRNATQASRDGVTSASYDDANEMLTFTPSPGSAKDMTYDNNGNLLTVTNSCGTTTYMWDVRNRLAGIDGYKPDCSTLTASFQYDAIGRRIEKAINETTTQYVYDGLDIIQEKQNGNVTANYIRTLNIDESLTRIKGSTVRHYVLDALGSVIALTDDTGVVKTTYTYDPFGNVTASGEASDNPFQYTGRENDGTGLYYYRARYYSPELQRFISEDPIGIKGGINKFSFVGNNPVNRNDPYGLTDAIPKLSGEVLSELAGNIVTKTIGGKKGLECASNFCRRGAAGGSQPWHVVQGECIRIFENTPTGNPPFTTSDEFLSECADVCQKILESKQYKKLCCPKK